MTPEEDADRSRGRPNVAEDRFHAALDFLHRSSDAPRVERERADEAHRRELLANRRRLIFSTAAVCAAMILTALAALAYFGSQLRATRADADATRAEANAMRASAQQMYARAEDARREAAMTSHEAAVAERRAAKAVRDAASAKQQAEAAQRLAAERQQQVVAAARRARAERAGADARLREVDAQRTRSTAMAMQATGMMDYQNRKYRDAIRYLSTAIRLTRDQAKLAFLYEYRGRALRLVNELDAARADMNRAIDLNRALGDGEGLAETYNSLGIIDDHRHDPAAAIVDYTRAIVVLARRRENAPQAYYNRALLHARQHDDRAAVTDFTTAIAQFADSPSDQADAYYERANALTRLHEPARAMADYDSAIKLNYALADAFRARGDLRCDEAARLAATDPHGAAAAYDRAVGDYERYLEIRPDDAEVRKLRADAQAKGQALGGASEPAASPAPAAKG